MGVWLNGEQVDIEDIDPNLRVQVVMRTIGSPIPEDCQVPPMNMPCNYGGSNGGYAYEIDLPEANDKMYNCPYFANSRHLKCADNPTNINCLECKE